MVVGDKVVPSNETLTDCITVEYKPVVFANLGI